MKLFKPIATGMILWLILTLFLAFYVVHADDIVTDEDFNLSFNVGESFQVQDVDHTVAVIFTVQTNWLNGTGHLTVTSQGGNFIITPSCDGSMIAIYSPSNAPIWIKLNGVKYAGAFAYQDGVTFEVSWTFGSQPPVTVIVAGSQTLYFRSDTRTVNTITAYGLDTTQSDSVQSVSDSGAGTVSFGFRVFIVHSSGTLVEVTDGTPEATIAFASSYTGMKTSSWACPETPIILGYDALEVVIYNRFGAGAWTAKASYITNGIMSKKILGQTWGFNLYVSYDGASSASFSFGDSTTDSRITNVGFKVPLTQEIQQYYWSIGDLINALFFGYYVLIGQAMFFGVCLFIGLGSMYIRYRNFGPILLFFCLFGGVGGVAWAFVPAPFTYVIWIFLLIGLAASIFKVIR